MHVTRYEPELAPKGEQWLWTTDEHSEALDLDRGEMLDLYRTSIGTRPWDGNADRPISIFVVEIS